MKNFFVARFLRAESIRETTLASNLRKISDVLAQSRTFNSESDGTVSLMNWVEMSEIFLKLLASVVSLIDSGT